MSGSLPLVPSAVCALRSEVQRLRGQLRERDETIAAQGRLLAERDERIVLLERRVGADSPNSFRPPSSDGPYRRPRVLLRRRSGRWPGKQRGAWGSTLRRVPTPDEVIDCDLACCAGCGRDLAGAPVSAVHTRQVVDIPPPPPPQVTEYRLITRRCPGCAARTAGSAPAGVSGRGQYGPEVCAQTANLVCGNYVPIGRARRLLAALAGLQPSDGFIATVRTRAARRLETTFLPHVRALLRQAEIVGVDETPARADGRLEYVHVACTEFLTALHTGRRSAAAIDAGGVLPDFTGVIVWDGYVGFTHLLAPVHSWCGAHSLRDLRGVFQADRTGQLGADGMAHPILDAHQMAQAARAAERTALTAAELATIRNHYRDAATKSLTDNAGRPSRLARDAATLARRFRDHEDVILRFTTNINVPLTNNQSERDVRPVKVQQRASGGCWHTLAGLADFAIVASYLSTATKWNLDTIDVLRQLFTTSPWPPPALHPS